LRANAQIHHTRFSRVAARLNPAPLRAQTRRGVEQISALGERGRRALGILHLRRRDRLTAATGRLATGLRAYRAAQSAKITRDREIAAALFTRARRSLAAALHRSNLSVAKAGQLLTALSYQSVLARGFALVRDPAGQPLRVAASVSPGLRLDIEFSDGRVAAVAEGGTPGGAAPTAAPPPSRPLPRPRRRGGGDPSQGNLFG
jgi:exodeoxyribonuclease VII large subunit